jgi:hypothetical protein
MEVRGVEHVPVSRLQPVDFANIMITSKKNVANT